MHYVHVHYVSAENYFRLPNTGNYTEYTYALSPSTPSDRRLPAKARGPRIAYRSAARRPRNATPPPPSGERSPKVVRERATQVTHAALAKELNRNVTHIEAET